MVQNIQKRSLFWPLILIAVGAIWLLSNLGVLQPASIGMLFRLWPLILIIIGLDLLFARSNPRLGTIIALGGVVVIVALMLLGPALGLVKSMDVKEASYNEPVGNATSAQVNLDIGVATTTIKALDDSNDLFKADLRYVGEVEFKSAGDSKKIINLSQKNNTGSTDFFGWFDQPRNLHWDIALNMNIPMALVVNSGVSDSTLSLSNLKITDLRVSGGVGTVNLSLPNMDDPYNVVLNGGVGDMKVDMAANSAIDFEIKGGVGQVIIDVPDDVAVKVDANTGVGSINVPSSYTKVSGGSKTVGEEGVWQSNNFDAVKRQITIHFDGGVGNLTVL